MSAEELIEKILDPKIEEPQRFQQKLSENFDDEESVQILINKFNHPDLGSRILVVQTLSLLKARNSAVEVLFEQLELEENQSIKTEIVQYLEAFDISPFYVSIFKLYITGGFKMKMLTQELLDYHEFDITPRVIKKIEKAWNHYSHNCKHDDAFSLLESDVNERITELKNLFE